MTPPEFAEACRAIVAKHNGDAAHRQLDALVTDLLSRLGYSEGMAIFIDGVRPYHADLIDSIDRVLEQTGMTPTQFGRRALGDPCFVADLRGGRRLRFATERTVMTFIDAQVGRNPEGGDAARLRAEHEHAVGEADAPNPSRQGEDHHGRD